MFYENIEPFSDFSLVADLENYVLAPDDWSVVIADIQGSTKAINEGRYKQVNMIGAACINAVLNVCQKGEIPYVFGGDGATMLIPKKRIAACKQALLGVRQLAENNYDLTLRVGVVSVGSINKSGSQTVLVGKYEISPGNMLATFSGGGVELAEQWIKSDTTHLVEDVQNQEPPDLSGLSCRWEPLQSKNGVMLSVLIHVTGRNDESRAKTYRQLIDSIADITNDDAHTAKPIDDSNMYFRWPPRGLKDEILATVGSRNKTLWTIHLYLNSLLQWALDRFDITAGGYRGKKYRVELRDNTDYRRFDDTLRMLLDCTPKQADDIEALLLKARSEQGKFVYGTHRADSALMTCLVFDLNKGEHMHFVDGNDGGFTSAAKQMKALFSE